MKAKIKFLTAIALLGVVTVLSYGSAMTRRNHVARGAGCTSYDGCKDKPDWSYLDMHGCISDVDVRCDRRDKA